MSGTPPEDRSPEPVTVDSMASGLCDLGVEAGGTVLVHGSLSSLGWVCGGPMAVVDALQRVVTEDGTVVMPTHSPGNMAIRTWNTRQSPSRGTTPYERQCLPTAPN